MIYCDSAYILKFYLLEPGGLEVRALIEANEVASCSHAQAEVCSAIHRKKREGLITETTARSILDQLRVDVAAGCWLWYPVDDQLIASVCRSYENLSASVFLRASDALHLACAKENGFRDIYSNDVHLLKAARHFGLKGKNVIK